MTSCNIYFFRCEVPEHLKSHIEVTSWLHEEGTAIEIFPERDPRGKYTLLQSGDLLIHHTSTYDTYKKYVCKTEHILSGIRRRSLNPARLTLKGMYRYSQCSKIRKKVQFQKYKKALFAFS